MAKHEVILHENTGATKEKAPYLANYVTKNTVLLADIATAAAPKAGMPAIKLQTLIENDIEALTELEKIGACRIHVDGGYVELRILGSFEASDSAWKVGENRLVVSFTPNAEIKNALVNETGTIVTDETSTKVRVDNVFDPARPKPTEVIYGQAEFVAQGVNLVMDDEGAKAEMVNDLGVIFPCTFVRSINRQNAVFKLPTLLEGGDYRLVVYSRGGETDGQMQSSFRKVKYLRVAAEPTITKIATAGKDGIVKGSSFDIEGTNLRYNTGDTVKAKWNAGGSAGEQLLAPTAVTATKMSFAAVSGFDALPDNTELTFEVTIDETKPVAVTSVIGA